MRSGCIYGDVYKRQQLPLFSPNVGAQMAQSETELAHLRIELASARNRIAGDLEKAFREVRKRRTATEVARLDLDVAHEQLSIDLAQMEEGRLGLRQVEAARMSAVSYTHLAGLRFRLPERLS